MGMLLIRMMKLWRFGMLGVVMGMGREEVEIVG
jgi:hypothetical protein